MALRALARTAVDLDDVAWLQAQAGDDVDLRWRALARKAELGGDADAEIDGLLDHDPEPGGVGPGHRGPGRGPDAGGEGSGVEHRGRGSFGADRLT